MMGIPQAELFSYQVNLEKRIRPDHPLRRIAQAVDFTLVRAEVAAVYGHNGNESVDPAILLKMMFLLFLDNVASERELMNIIPERLDYLWFLGYGLDDEIPNHSVLSKARRRWGQEVFQRLFIRTVEQCVAAGLVSGDKLHVDASLIAANASKDSVVKSSPELMAAYAAAYAAQEKKLNDPADRPCFQAVNDVEHHRSRRGLGAQRRTRCASGLSPSSSGGRWVGSHYGRGNDQREHRGEQETGCLDGAARAEHGLPAQDGSGRLQIRDGGELCRLSPTRRGDPSG